MPLILIPIGLTAAAVFGWWANNKVDEVSGAANPVAVANDNSHNLAVYALAALGAYAAYHAIKRR